MLRTLIVLVYSINIYNYLLLIFYYLIFVVCERVLGLTLLIVLIRSIGNDNLRFLNLLLW